MAGQIFWLKFRDTTPILEVALKNPDGSAFNLTGATKQKLHIYRNDGSVVSRDMVTLAPATNGIQRYQWLDADWDTGNVAGYLTVGPSLPLKPTSVEHKMEYEVVNASGRQTFPNDGYDVLRILADIGQG
jgi:hypothetical protein